VEQFEQVHILLVEDNPLDAELTLYGLQTDHLRNPITWVKDGQEALDYIFRQGAYHEREDILPGLILLDLKMPKVDGMDVLAALKADAHTRRIPVVVMTSSREECDIVKSYDLGANSYVVKPVNFEGISTVAKQAGLYWMMVNVRPPH